MKIEALDLLAAAYHNNESLAQARNDNGVIRLGEQAIVQPCFADTDTDQLVIILNESNRNQNCFQAILV